jgi:HNH endonuclease
VDESAAGDNVGGPVSESSAGDGTAGPADGRSWPQVRVDAFMDLVRIGRHHAAAGLAGGVHHLRFWEHGGPTNIENGISLCPRHHTLLHQGFTASGDANHVVTFRRPDGAVLGTTRPQNAVSCRPAVARAGCPAA